LAEICIAGITTASDDKDAKKKEEKDGSALQVERIRDTYFSLLPDLQSHMARITLTIDNIWDSIA
jgi:hypothetical protein